MGKEREDEKLVSVIVPHYRAFDLIPVLLGSIPEDERLELIVIDDKSEDRKKVRELAEIIKKRGGIFLENTGKKKGAGVCRNLGLDAAKGKWVLFADADDYFMPGAFDVVFRYADADADQVCFCPCSVLQGTKEMGSRHLRYEKLVRNYAAEPNRLHELELRYKFYGPVSRMIRNEMIREHKIHFEEIRSSEDVMFSVRAGFYARSVLAVDDCIYCIVCSSDSLSSGHDRERFLLGARVDAEYCRFLQEHLSQNDYRLLSAGGWKFIYMALKEHYGIRTALEVYRIMKEEKVPIGFVNACRRKLRSGRR
jgi:glycosyltransferase involved in cell wall biosynthesis